MTFKDDLFQVADAAAEARTRIRSESLQKPLTAIRMSCDEAKRAWSGSNIGYHATVYFEGLQPKPPDAEFSPEWGLMDRWPTHQPHPGWRNWDHQVVIDQILARAGGPDVSAIEHALVPLREAFSDLKEQAISLLTAALSNTQDQFLDRKLKQIEPLKIADARTIELSLVPRGQFWSRDSRAMSQGLRPAPHQSLVGFTLSATVLEDGLDSLEKATRQAAAYLQRIGDHGKAEPIAEPSQTHPHPVKATSKAREVLTLKPRLWGVSIDLKEAWRRAVGLWRARN